MQPPRFIDKAALTELAEAIGTEGLELAVRQFEIDARDASSSLRTFMESRNEIQLRKTAHKLKGLYRQFGAISHASLAERMENTSGEELYSLGHLLEAASASAISDVRDAAKALI